METTAGLDLTGVSGPGLGRESPTPSEMSLAHRPGGPMPTRSLPSSNIARSFTRYAGPRARCHGRPARRSAAARRMLRHFHHSTATAPANADTGHPATRSRSTTAAPRSPSTPAPERVVTIKSSTLELLLALGLEDRIVGTAFSDGPVPEELADAASGIEVLSDKVPVAGGRARGRARPRVRRLGVEPLRRGRRRPRHAREARRRAPTSPPPRARSEGYMPDPLTFDEVFREFERGRRDLRRPGCRGRPRRASSRPSSTRSSRTPRASPPSGTARATTPRTSARASARRR